MSGENKKAIFEMKDILQILPHRYPLLLVDRILEMDLEKSIVIGQKNVTINENFFQGHFPGIPVMPGVLILEALAQTGGILVHEKYGNEGKIAILLSINEAKFRNPVKPGDVLILKCEGIHISSKGGRVKGEASVDGKIAVQAEIGFVLIDKNQI